MNKSKLILCILILLVICFSQSAIFASEMIEISFGHSGKGTGSLEDVYAQVFKKDLEEKFKDKIVVNIFPGSQLGSNIEMIEQVKNGITNIIITSSQIVAVAPEMGIFDMPFLFRDRDHAYGVLDGPIGQKLAKYLEKSGVIHLGYGELGFRNISNNIRPIKTPDDLKGLLLRVPDNRVRIEVFNMLGASATPLDFTELYTALQQGVVDGQENPLASIYTAKLYEVQKYISLTKHIYTPSHALMNKDFYNSLPVEIREYLVEEVAPHAREVVRNRSKQADEELLAVFEKEGIKINEVDTRVFADKASQIWKKYEDIYGEFITEILEATE